MKSVEKSVERKRSFAVEFAFESRKHGLGRAFNQFAVGCEKERVESAKRTMGREICEICENVALDCSIRRTKRARFVAGLGGAPFPDGKRRRAGSPTVASATNGTSDATSDASAIRARPARRKSKERLNARE